MVGVQPDGPPPASHSAAAPRGPCVQRGGSSSVAQRLVAERIVCAVVAAPTAA
jgi:hypothetical protein